MIPETVDRLTPEPAAPPDIAGQGIRVSQPPPSRWLPPARGAWLVLALCFVGLFIIGTLAYYRQSAEFPVVGNFGVADPPDAAAYRAALAQIGLPVSSYAWLMVALQCTLLFACALTSLVLYLSRRNSWWALFVGLTLITMATAYPTTSLALGRAYPQFAGLFVFLDGLALLFFLELFFVFPDGRFVPRWTRWPAIAAAVTLILAALLPQQLPVPQAAGLGFSLVNWLLLITMIYAQVYRYVRVSGPIQRQQTKWAVAGMLLMLVTLAALSTAPNAFPNLVSSPARASLYDMVATALLLVVTLVVPLSLGISMMRYRLWDIDRIIYRTLIYVPLTGLLAGIFSITLATSQKLFTAFTGARSDTAVLLSTLLVVAAFTPIRDGIQALVNRYFKGTPDPRQTLKAHNQEMRSFVEMMDELQIAQRALSDCVAAFGADGGAVYMRHGARLALACSCGAWTETTPASISLPLQSGDRQLGLFQLGRRHDGLPYSLKDQARLRETANLLGNVIASRRKDTSRWTWQDAPAE